MLSKQTQSRRWKFLLQVIISRSRDKNMVTHTYLSPRRLPNKKPNLTKKSLSLFSSVFFSL
jgi:hypothetical protein